MSHGLVEGFLLQETVPSAGPANQERRLMNLTNDRYLILIGREGSAKRERYYRDECGWVKVSMRGRTFRMTADQVLNHVLPAVAGVKPHVTVTVEHHEGPARDSL